MYQCRGGFGDESRRPIISSGSSSPPVAESRLMPQESGANSAEQVTSANGRFEPNLGIVGDVGSATHAEFDVQIGHVGTVRNDRHRQLKVDDVLAAPTFSDSDCWRCENGAYEYRHVLGSCRRAALEMCRQQSRLSTTAGPRIGVAPAPGSSRREASQHRNDNDK